MAYEIYKPEWGASRPIRGVLFDMDGLVLDTEKFTTAYTYDEATGSFVTLPSEITVPAATYTQDPDTGAWVITPGVTTLVVTGTV